MFHQGFMNNANKQMQKMLNLIRVFNVLHAQQFCCSNSRHSSREIPFCTVVVNKLMTLHDLGLFLKYKCVCATERSADDVLLLVSLCLTPCLLGACQISPRIAFLTALKQLIC